MLLLYLHLLELLLSFIHFLHQRQVFNILNHSPLTTLRVTMFLHKYGVQNASYRFGWDAFLRFMKHVIFITWQAHTTNYKFWDLFTEIQCSLSSLTLYPIFSVLKLYIFKIQVWVQATESQTFQAQRQGKFEKLRKKNDMWQKFSCKTNKQKIWYTIKRGSPLTSSLDRILGCSDILNNYH